MLKIISCVILVAMLAGCLPIGIRGSSLPNYADAPTKRGADVAANCPYRLNARPARPDDCSLSVSCPASTAAPCG